MAKSEEKSQSMLNKWWSMKRGLYLRDPDEPPPLVTDCNSLSECYRWREQTIKEIGDKVAEIQNAGMGEFKVRAMNDEINRYINLKRQWEERIKELGGQDFKKKEQKFYDADGQELPGSGNYKYFGAAKDLPGVRELFFTEVLVAPPKDMSVLYKKIPFNYFEFGEKNEDYQLLKKKQQEMLLERRKNFVEKNKSYLLKLEPEFEKLENKEEFLTKMNFQEFLDLKFLEVEKPVQGIVKIIKKKEIEEQIELEEKKKKILDMYVENQEEMIPDEKNLVPEFLPNHDLEKIYGDEDKTNN